MTTNDKTLSDKEMHEYIQSTFFIGYDIALTILCTTSLILIAMVLTTHTFALYITVVISVAMACMFILLLKSLRTTKATLMILRSKKVFSMRSETEGM